MEADTFFPMLKQAAGFFAFAAVEMTILFIGISFLVGVINEFLPADKVKHIMSAKKGHGYFIGAGLGGLTPFCSCSSIPITVGLLKAGAGFGPTMSFLFASPLVNPIIVGLFVTAFGLKIAALYSVLALGMAVLASFLLNNFGFEKHIRQEMFNTPLEAGCGCDSESDQTDSGADAMLFSGQQPAACCAADSPNSAPVTPFAMAPVTQPESACCSPSSAAIGNPQADAPGAGRWQRIFKEAVNQFRTFLPFIFLGIGIGAIFHGFVPKDIVVSYAGPDNPMAIPVAAVIGIPLYVRVSTMIPVSLSLIGKGMSLGAVVALVIGGAGASLPEMVMMKGLFRGPILVAFLISVFGMAVSAGFILNLM